MYLLFIWGRTKWFWSGLHPFRGPLEGVGPENLDFFGPKWHSIRSWPFQGQKKFRFSGPNPSNGPRNGCSPLQNHFRFKLLKNGYIGNFMCQTWPAAVCVLLLMGGGGPPSQLTPLVGYVHGTKKMFLPTWNYRRLFKTELLSATPLIFCRQFNLTAECIF